MHREILPGTLAVIFLDPPRRDLLSTGPSDTLRETRTWRSGGAGPSESMLIRRHIRISVLVDDLYAIRPVSVDKS